MPGVGVFARLSLALGGSIISPDEKYHLNPIYIHLFTDSCMYIVGYFFRKTVNSMIPYDFPRHPPRYSNLLLFLYLSPLSPIRVPLSISVIRSNLF